MNRRRFISMLSLAGGATVAAAPKPKPKSESYMVLAGDVTCSVCGFRQFLLPMREKIQYREGHAEDCPHAKNNGQIREAKPQRLE